MGARVRTVGVSEVAEREGGKVSGREGSGGGMDGRAVVMSYCPNPS